EALAEIEENRTFAVVVSDMRMPGMDGAALLAEVRGLLPDAARILLTGYADLDSALRAVNQGQIFRYLTKPCPPDVLRQAVTDGVEQHRLARRSRDETLHRLSRALAFRDQITGIHGERMGELCQLLAR